MKSFLKKTILLFLPILILGIGAEISLRQIPNDYLVKKQFLEQESKNIETLILGSSHAYYGLNPEEFDSFAFNAAINGQSLDYDFNIYKKYKDNLESLKTIILPISYPTLWGRLKEKKGASWLIKNYEMYYGFKEDKIIPFHLEICNRPLEVNLRRIFKYYLKNQSPKFSNKFGWGSKTFDKEKYTFLESGEIGANQQTYDDLFSEKSKKIYKENVELLKIITNWANEKNIKILLLTTPGHESYRKFLNDGQLDQTLQFAQSFADKNDNCYFLNLLEHPNFKREDFRDAHHMSISGASKLTKIVNDEVNKIHGIVP